MGCDIHCYVEYRFAPGEEYDFWRNFGGRINPGRDYMAFGYMAGVRAGVPPVVAPRGMLDVCSGTVFGEAWLYINHDPEATDEGDMICWETAQRYMRYGREARGEYVPPMRTTYEGTAVTSQGLVYPEAAGRPTHVAHPDWHTHSWLTTAEFAQVITLAQLQNSIGWSALLAVMQHFEDKGHAPRLVFWFDN